MRWGGDGSYWKGPRGRVDLGSCRVDRGGVGWSSWRVQVGTLKVGPEDVPLRRVGQME